MQGLYEEQIRERAKKDNEKTAEALGELASVITGKKASAGEVRHHQSRTLPNRALGFRDLLGFMLSNIPPGDAALGAGAALFATLLGMAAPYVTRMMFLAVIPAGRQTLALSAGALLFGVALSILFMSVYKSLITAKISVKVGIAAESAVTARLFALPAGFFKDYGTGELASRVMSVGALADILCSFFFETALAALFSFVYLFLISELTPGMALPALLAIFAQFATALFEALVNAGLSKKTLMAKTKVSGIVFALFSGIQKIRLAACEKRAFFKWAKAYKKQGEAAFGSVLQPLAKGIRIASPFVGSFFILLFAVSSNLQPAEFVAFMSAYGIFSGMLLSFFSGAPALGLVGPVAELIDPVLKAIPETGQNKRAIKQLGGNIEINNLCFRYGDNSPMVIDDLSLKIKRGQYVAIVGKSGCGKSTLLRLLLGFETPLSGAVYYDNTDISKIDPRSLRRQIGTVLQNGKLLSGDIFSNIALTSPGLDLKGAWEAAEVAGVAGDIRDMPMGMHTVVGEGGGGISGGQRQRILIARAIASRPKILFFDEATSALDNMTQKQVSDSLAALKSTRIVIAHRLSTIRQCDRIIVLDKGKIVEDGSYEELMALGGEFAELARRQELEGVRN